MMGFNGKRATVTFTTDSGEHYGPVQVERVSYREFAPPYGLRRLNPASPKGLTGTAVFTYTLDPILVPAPRGSGRTIRARTALGAGLGVPPQVGPGDGRWVLFAPAGPRALA